MVEATWVNVNGVWGVKVVGAAKEGDQVMVRKRTGSATLQTLGQQLAAGVFAKAGKVSQVRRRPWRSLAATIERVYGEDIEAGAAAHAQDWDDFRN
jgi:hypothetical protein